MQKEVKAAIGHSKEVAGKRLADAERVIRGAK